MRPSDGGGGTYTPVPKKKPGPVHQSPSRTPIPNKKKPGPVHQSPSRAPISNPAPVYTNPAPLPVVRSNSTGQISLPNPAPQQSFTPAPAPVAAAAPVVPATPSIGTWLGSDPTYLQQMANFGATHNNYVTEQGRQTNSYNTDYTNKLRELAVQRGIGQDNLNNDYASRGILHSGLYGAASGVYNKDQNTQTANLATGKANFLSELQAALGQFVSQQTMDTQQARQDAINRRASKYGV